ncbi:BREX-1 system phosphatase PglZ type B [Nonomuraea sp. LPB2021202275-12-8]|uniref:BREX-1 system phosphatase PglZ type B n=1 Tax=Nonomuraea sp. LPB2021202275-12-8 TaxID=3120159 RepID=UPI003FA5891E
MKTILDRLIDGLRTSASTNANDRVAPVAILWPDPTRSFEAIIPLLRARNVPLCELGDYAPAYRRGSAYYVRCLLAGDLDYSLIDALSDTELTCPIVYLPGFGRNDLRAVEDCPLELRPLAELQYSGALFVQSNGSDWNVGSWLRSPAGANLDLASDQATQQALGRTGSVLFQLEINQLRALGRLRAGDLDELITPDPARSLLLWISEPASIVSGHIHDSFAATCLAKYGFDIREGNLAAAERLGRRNGPWSEVWDRFVDAPQRYAGIPALLGRVNGIDSHFPDSWPQHNDELESELRAQLAELDGALPGEASSAIARFETRHGARRGWVWAQLGQAPLAIAVGHLHTLATLSVSAVFVGTPVEMATAYETHGWMVDAAALAASAAVSSPADVAAVRKALRAIYKPWLERSAEVFQNALSLALESGSFPECGKPLPEVSDGECVMFIDALRLDLAHRLSHLLQQAGAQVAIETSLASLPTITKTSKYAVSPVPAAFGPGDQLGAAQVGSSVAATADHLRKALGDAGIQVLRDGETGDPTGRGWTEAGDIDGKGHNQSASFPRALDAELQLVAERISDLLEAGWRSVRVITDHGFLLLPGGLPKAHLDLAWTVERKGRCARLKLDAPTTGPTYPWRWDPDVRVAVGPNICCFEAGKEYEHGGVSPQELITPLITVAGGGVARVGQPTLAVKWNGMRAIVSVTDGPRRAYVDIRRKAGSAATSLLQRPVKLGDEGQARILVTDPDMEGDAVFVVLLVADSLVAQQTTSVGQVG